MKDLIFKLPLRNRLTGIIQDIIEVEITPGYPEIFVCVANIADTSVYGFQTASDGSGAGLTREDAFKAAVGEAVERYASAIVQKDELIFGSYNQLIKDGYNPIRPSKFTLFHESQYDKLPFSRFDDDTEIAWTYAQNLTFKEDCLVPACMVYMPYEPYFLDKKENIIAPSISTGCACAESYDEAILKGICELIERDAFMIMWRNKLQLQKVEIDEKSRIYKIFRDRFLKPGLEYTIIHTTLDMPIPSFFGLLVDKQHNPPPIIVGGAAHPDPSQAVLKTLVELIQGLYWFLNTKPQKKIKDDFSNIKTFEDRFYLYAFNDMHFVFDFIWNNENIINLSDLEAKYNKLKSLRLYIEELKELQLEVIVKDLTTVDIDECELVVTRTIIPGIEMMEGNHSMQFLGGKRWKEVPMKLGLIKEQDLNFINPYPHPYP